VHSWSNMYHNISSFNLGFLKIPVTKTVPHTLDVDTKAIKRCFLLRYQVRRLCSTEIQRSGMRVKHKLVSTYIDRSTTQLHGQGEEPTVKGAYMVRMVTTETRLRTTQ
jgi:hypothetical protein